MKVSVIIGLGKRREIEVFDWGIEVEIGGKTYAITEQNLPPDSTPTCMSIQDVTTLAGSLAVYPLAENTIRVK